ncbi:MAG TPA: BTAD domain-containing putative transcriptional regulator [Actinomycetes bacterium]|nr:BTAD domain-containing putative transcriptional regulator [Actinomycetes bacterium]
MYLPPVLRPLATSGAYTPAVQHLAEVPVSVVRGVPGSYLAERLAGVIDSWQRLGDCVWLRADAGRPSELARSLGMACQHRWSSGETVAAAEWRPDPHPRLDRQLQLAPDGAVIVIELGGRVTAGVGRLIRAIRPAITDRGVRLVVVAESRFHPPIGHRPDWVISAADLLDRAALERYPSDRTRERLIGYAGRRVAVLDDVLAAAQLWPQDAVDEAIHASVGLPSLLGRLTRVLLDQMTPEQRSALEVAATIGYWHPQMGTHPVGSEQLRPWLIPLEQQWSWVRPVWLPFLRRELARPTGSGRRLPDHLSAAYPAAGSAASAAAPTRPATRTGTRHGVLEARLLGPLEVRVNGSAVSSWNGPRGASVLRYLLARRQHACSRDELLEEFWPDVPIAAARNRLQVAVSGLRRAFLDVTARNVVEYADGGYRINPDFDVEVDAESFDQALRTAAAAERADNRDAARTAYRQAVALYRGDFAADAPFEQWSLLPRESLRIKLVDALDRLSRIELADRRIDDCIATAHRMLDVDPCREDAHRLLMRCYADQGRTYQALRQYEFCQRILRATIDASPARDTTALYHAIRSSAA